MCFSVIILFGESIVALLANAITLPHFFSIVCSCMFHIGPIVASLDSTTQTAQPSGADWQEEVYQKVQCHFYYHFYFLTEALLEQQKLVKQTIM